MTTDTTYTIANSGHVFYMPNNTAMQGTEKLKLFHTALAALNSLAKSKSEIMGDTDLSGPGKQKRLAPEMENAWWVLAESYIRLAALDTATDAQDAAFLDLPELDNGAGAVAAIDIELRGWFKGLPIDERTKVMNSITAAAPDDERYSRISLAVLRSPAPMFPPHEIEFFKSVWEKSKRLGDPDLAVSIDAQRSESEWLVRGLGHVQGILFGVSEWSRQQLLVWLVLNDRRLPAAKAFGFSPMDLASAKRGQQVAGRIPATA
jgi:hypothetical protein